MVDSVVFDGLKKVFMEYSGRFGGDRLSEDGIELKVEHSIEVCNNALDIGKSIGLSDSLLWLVGIAGLFHDVGRFYQFSRYGTFVDEMSVDHGKVGVEVLRRENLLRKLDAADREVVEFAVEYHNKPELPACCDDDKMCALKVVRDADKLDILRVVLEHYEGKRRFDPVELGLPDVSGVSDEAVEDVLNGRVVFSSHVRKLNDLKLLYMSWVYDINFNVSLRMFVDRGYLGRIKDSLNDVSGISAVLECVEGYINERLDEHSERRCV